MTMIDAALASAGSQVYLATSCDEKYPPENMIDGNTDTFWTSTGLFPQEFVVTFNSLMKINSIKLHCCNVEGLKIEKSTESSPLQFELVHEKVLDAADGQLQTDEVPASGIAAQHLKFTVISGYDHFVAVHRIEVDATAVH